MSSFEESLIENVRAHNSLYDVFSAEYKDHSIRKEAWEEIGVTLQVSAEKCKSEWSKLRNCFLNAIRRRRSKTSGQATKNILPWKYSQQMEFILPFLENREVHSNLETDPSPSNTQKPNDNDISDTTGNISYKLSAESQPDTINNSNLERSFESKKEMALKRKNPDHAGEMVEIFRENASIRRERYEKKQSYGHDDVELFYLSMAKIAKRLPKAKEAKLRMEVCNKVSEAELAHLLEVETFNQQYTALNRQVLTNPVLSNTQNQTTHLQTKNVSLQEEPSEGSWSTSSSTHSNDQAYVYDKQNYCRPILNTNLRHIQQPFTYISEESSSNQYESLN